MILVGFFLLANGAQVSYATEEPDAEQINPMPFNPKPAAGSRFAGDINGDGIMDPADMVYFVRYLFRGGPPPPNMEDADLNGDGYVNVADMITLSKWLWFYTW